MKKFKKLLIGSATLATVVVPTMAVISCGFGGADASAAQKVTKEDVADQVTAEKAVADAGKDASTNIEVGVRTTEIDKYKNIAKIFNELPGNHGKVTIKEELGDPGFLTTYSLKAASGGMPTLAIADSNVIAGILAGTADYAKPIIVSDFLGHENSSLYNVIADETDFEKKDINESHLTVDSNSNGVQFAFPLGYTQTSLYANWRMISKDLEGKIYAYAPNDDGKPTMIDKDGQPTSVLANAVVLADNAHYDSIQEVINGAGFKPEEGKDVVQDAHHSKPVGSWLGWGPANLSQRIYSITKSIETNEDNKNLAGDFQATKGLTSVHSMVFKESLANFSLLASAGLKASDGTPMFNVDTQTLTEKGFNKQVTKDGFSDALARYFWNGFAGYMSKLPGGFINHNGIQGGGPTTGEVEAFEYKQVMFMKNAKWAEKWANGNWQKIGSGGAGDESDYNGANNMLTSGDVVKFSVPYGSVSGDSYILSSESSDAQSLVAKRFLKFIEQQSKDVTYKDAKFNNTITSSIADAVSSNFLSSYKPNADKQKLDQTPDKAKIEVKLRELNTQSIKDRGAEAMTDTEVTENVDRIYKSALKGFDLGLKDGKNPSDKYQGFSGTVWNNTDSDFFSVMQAILQRHLEFFKDNNHKQTWTYEEFKSALASACQEYFKDRAMK